MFRKRILPLFSDSVPLKIVLIGDSMVGKSAICKSYIRKEPYLAYQPTVSETHEIIVSISKRDYKVVLWDTAGVEEWDQLRRHDYTNADCFILCYAVSNTTSFENVQDKWIPELREYCPNAPVLLVGTKTDYRTSSNHWISTEEGKQLKDRVKAEGFAECSFKSIASIEGVFIQAVALSEKYRGMKEPTTSKSRLCIIL